MIKHVCADCGAKFHMTESFMQHNCPTPTVHPEDCPHLSWTDVDQTPIDDPGKLWQCDRCGLIQAEGDR